LDGVLLPPPPISPTSSLFLARLPYLRCTLPLWRRFDLSLPTCTSVSFPSLLAYLHAPPPLRPLPPLIAEGSPDAATAAALALYADEIPDAVPTRPPAPPLLGVASCTYGAAELAALALQHRSSAGDVSHTPFCSCPVSLFFLSPSPLAVPWAGGGLSRRQQ